MVPKSRFGSYDYSIKKGHTKTKYEIGDHHPCPTCGSLNAKIVWINKEKNAIAIQCPQSRPEHKKKAVILVDLNE